MQVTPNYGLDSIAAVLPAAAGALGVPLETSTGLDSMRCQAVLDLPSASRVVVVLCDGLGLENLIERAGHARFLRPRISGARALSTTFPSTTACALSTLGTGTAPGLTSMLGYTQRNPQTGSLVNLVSFTEQTDPARAAIPGANASAPALSLPITSLQREPTVFEAIVAGGVPVTSIGLSRFAGSGMTAAALRGGRFLGVDHVGRRVDAVLDALREPGLVYLYWGELDKVGHTEGYNSAKWGSALEVFDFEMARLAQSVPRGTLLLITADHGQIEVDFAQQIDVAQVPALVNGVELVAGEPRALHVYTQDAENVAAKWRAYLGERADVWTKREATAAGLLGPVAAHVDPWVGDVLAAPTGAVTIVDSRTQTPDSLRLKGVHGSLSTREMMIPLLTELRE